MMLLFLVCYAHAAQDNPNTNHNLNFTKKTHVLLQTMPYSDYVELIDPRKFRDIYLEEKIARFTQKILSTTKDFYAICKKTAESNDNWAMPDNKKLIFDCGVSNIEIIYLKYEFLRNIDKSIYEGLVPFFDDKRINVLNSDLIVFHVVFSEKFGSCLGQFVLLFITQCIKDYEGYKNELENYSLTINELDLRLMFFINNLKLLNGVSEYLKKVSFQEIEDCLKNFRLWTEQKEIWNEKVFGDIAMRYCREILLLAHQNCIWNGQMQIKEVNIINANNNLTIDRLVANNLIEVGENITIVPYVPDHIRTILKTLTMHNSYREVQNFNIFFEINLQCYFYNVVNWIKLFIQFDNINMLTRRHIFQRHIRAIFALAETQVYMSLQCFVKKNVQIQDLSITFIRLNNAETDLITFREFFAADNNKTCIISDKLLVRLRRLFEEYFIFCIYEQALNITDRCFLYQEAPGASNCFGDMGLSTMSWECKDLYRDSLEVELYECLGQLPHNMFDFSRNLKCMEFPEIENFDSKAKQNAQSRGQIVLPQVLRHSVDQYQT